MMDNKRLTAFLKSAELGSLSAAAEELGYSTSAVSQLVASLEKEFDMQLLVRTTRGVRPTEEAKVLIPVIEDYLSREHLIYDYVAGIKGLSEGSLTITAYPSIATAWLPEVVGRFKEDYPGVSITIMECVRSDIYRHLDDLDAELAFLAYEEDMHYEWIPLADVDLIAVLPETHRLAKEQSYPVKEIEHDDFILSSYGQETEILDMLSQYDIDPEVKYSSYDTPVNLAMVQRGLGVTIVNELSATNWKEGLVKLPLDPPQKVEFGIAFCSQDRLSPVAKKFLEYAVKDLTRSEG